ncbi:MAG: PEGA domain-containing protein, partial [Campylobacterota bacterium]|nr:PEGA domain-containing protein [Campylobacterota bacterium]
VKKDLKVAINYYKLAAKQNNKNAIKSLDVINKLLAKKKKENMQKESMEVGYLTVRSNVNNDKVYLNGKFVGKTKLILPLSSNTAHSIEIRKAGYKTYKFQPVRVQTKEKKTIRAYLERL